MGRLNNSSGEPRPLPRKATVPSIPNWPRSCTIWPPLCYLQKRYSEAERYCRRSLAIREKAFGANHPDLAKSLETYAVVLRKLKRTVEADLIDERVKSFSGK